VKIVLTGSHGTGKSSLAKALAKKLEYPLIDNVTRRLLKKDFSLKYIKSSFDEIKDSDTKFKVLLFQLTIVSEYLDRFRKEMDFVSTRCFIDHLAYSRVNNFPKPFLSLLEGLVWEWKQKLVIIYVPIESPMKKDKFRVGDEVFRKKVNREVYKILKEFNIAYLRVSGSLEERLQQVLGALYE